MTVQHYMMLNLRIECFFYVFHRGIKVCMITRFYALLIVSKSKIHLKQIFIFGHHSILSGLSL